MEVCLLKVKRQQTLCCKELETRRQKGLRSRRRALSRQSTAASKASTTVLSHKGAVEAWAWGPPLPVALTCPLRFLALGR